MILPTGSRDWTPVYSGAAQAGMGATAQALKKVGVLLEAGEGQAAGMSRRRIRAHGCTF
jgi:hypothetical protein